MWVDGKFDNSRRMADWCKRCDWSGWWGYFGSLNLPDKWLSINIGGEHDMEMCTLCMRCHDLKEPPWFPNKRDRCKEWLLQVFRKTTLARLDIHVHREIAEYLAKNDP